MEHYSLPTDLNLIGFEVKTFPNGIGDSFDILYNTFGQERSYYGISWFDENETIKYYAMTTELPADNQLAENYQKLEIQKGNYRTITVFNWLSKTNSIKDVFHELLKDARPNQNSPCIEWYKSDTEMVCMVKVD
ncbi:MAG: hypothetical protein K2P88_14785 [Chitinophagaceae bacterium]|uniref:hypothetical protein n=1 Tax=unclassified Paraflavitalea TaxID=2798305 RepID=UPI003D3490A8|nr:hypothetical protein [Chitinophagaceae bacterium]